MVLLVAKAFEGAFALTEGAPSFVFAHDPRPCGELDSGVDELFFLRFLDGFFVPVNEELHGSFEDLYDEL